MHARVPIPRKGTARLKSLVAMTVLQALNIVYVRIRQRFKSAPPLRRFPDRPHGMAKGGLVGSSGMGAKIVKKVADLGK